MAEQPRSSIGKPSLKDRAIDELKVYLYITLYFWVIFLMFDVIRANLKAEGVSIADGGFAMVNALVLAKVALITEALYKKRRAGGAPLAFRVVLHSLGLALVLIAFNLLEEGIKAALHGDSVTANFDFPHVSFVLGKAAVFFVLLIPFSAFQELANVLGAEKLVSLFFEPPDGRRYSLVRDGRGSERSAPESE